MFAFATLVVVSAVVFGSVAATDNKKAPPVKADVAQQALALDKAVMADILKSQQDARKRKLKMGTSRTGGVECIDGCVFFGGLQGKTATGMFADLKQKLTRSPKATDAFAQRISVITKQSYTDKRRIGNAEKFKDDLMVVFRFFHEAKPSLKVLKKGTRVVNSMVDRTGTVVTFNDRLKRNRQVLAIVSRDGKKLDVFTSCSNFLGSIPGRQRRVVPPQREFKCQNVALNQICGTPSSGPEQQPVGTNTCCDTAPTTGYPEDGAEQNIGTQPVCSNNCSSQPPTGTNSGGGAGTAPGGTSDESGGTTTGSGQGTTDVEGTEGSGPTTAPSSDPGEP